jgi:diguanylate cyclase (GGDEF)-like protein
MSGKTIAFLGETSFDRFQGQMFEGAVKSARENNVNLVRLSLESIENESRATNQLDIYIDLIKKMNPDGLMFLGWNREIAMYEKSFIDYFHATYRIPILSIGKKIEHVPSVFMDGAQNIRELLQHLVDVHGYRNIVFIKPYSPDERYAAYESFMKERGLFRADLAISNEMLGCEIDWLFQKRVSQIINYLFDEQKVDVDAIMSMYTYEAFFLLEALKKRGIQIPKQIALTSWEDGDMGKYSTPPITSVYFPFFEQGYEGLNLLYRKIQGTDIPITTLVPGRVIIRRTCGCLTERTKTTYKKLIALPEISLVPLQSESIRDILNNLDLRLNCLESRELITRFVDNLLDNKSNTFFEHIEQILSTHNGDINFINEMQDDLFTLQSSIMPLLSALSEYQIAARNIWITCQILLQETIADTIAYHDTIKIGSEQILQDIGQKIASTLDTELLFPVIDSSLQRIGIEKCVIALIPNEIMTSGEEFLYYYNKDRKNPPPGQIASSKGTYIYQLNEDDPDWTIFTAHILHIGHTLLGYIFFEPKLPDERIYQTLSVHLSSAIHGALSLKKLQESNRRLSELDKLKNDFIANITHDFRSPLMVTLNTVDLGLKYDNEGDIATIRRRYTTVMNASLRLKNTIDRLLDIAKMDAHGVKLNIRKVRLREYLESVIDFYNSAVISTSIIVRGVLPPEEISDFYTDQDRLEEIISNIISNALKYISPTEGEIVISLIEAGSAVRITIADNGIGIPSDKLETIFGRFEQIYDDSMAHYKGTGIGLSFSRQLAEYLGGSIWAESDGPGKGARFNIELRKGMRPADTDDNKSLDDVMIGSSQVKRAHTDQMIRSQLCDDSENESIIRPVMTLNAEGEYDPFKGVIIAIDDNPHVCEIVCEYLLHAGYRNVVMATNGKTGLDLIYDIKPDLIICDYNMPVLSGKELHDHLHENPDYRGIPVIFLTAIVNRKIMVERKKKGAVAYLQKPIDQNEFLATVESSLRKQMELKKLVQQATLDALTGICNKHSITKFIKDRFMLRSYSPLSVIFFDIDNFKSLNDTYGHRAGDAVLSRIGSIVRGALRGYDKAGRYGGDEFLIVLPDTTLSDAAIVAEKIRSLIDADRIICENATLHISGSFGVASLIDNGPSIAGLAGIGSLGDLYEIADSKKADWESIEKTKSRCADILVECADRALYESKRTKCPSCGAASLKDDNFRGGKCPACGNPDILSGRNRITLFSDNIIRT